MRFLYVFVTLNSVYVNFNTSAETLTLCFLNVFLDLKEPNISNMQVFEGKLSLIQWSAKLIWLLVSFHEILKHAYSLKTFSASIMHTFVTKGTLRISKDSDEFLAFFENV